MNISSVGNNPLASLLSGKNEQSEKNSFNFLDTSVTDSKTANSSSKPRDAFEELERYMKMSPFEIFRENWLKKHNMTEDDVAAMPPEKQKALEESIREEFKKMAKESSGMQSSLATSLLV